MNEPHHRRAERLFEKELPGGWEMDLLDDEVPCLIQVLQGESVLLPWELKHGASTTLLDGCIDPIQGCIEGSFFTRVVVVSWSLVVL